VIALSEATQGLGLRLGLDLLCIFVLVWGIYLPRRSSRDFAFTYVMLNIVTFGLAWLMNRVPMDIGFGLGMFAIFGILRYRTEALRIRDLTYLFIGIGLAVINGIEHESISWDSVILLDLTTLGVTGLLEFFDSRTGRSTVRLIYDRIDLLGDADRTALISDIETRLKLQCKAVDVGTVDLLRETVELWVTVEETHG
jgi:hypothetical protein